MRSLRREASWRKAMMERRPRAAITHRFQWTLIAQLEVQTLELMPGKELELEPGQGLEQG